MVPFSRSPPKIHDNPHFRNHVRIIPLHCPSTARQRLRLTVELKQCPRLSGLSTARTRFTGPGPPPPFVPNQGLIPYTPDSTGTP